MIDMLMGRLAGRIRHWLMPCRFPLRWLSRGPYWYLIREPLLEKVIPDEGWISWEQARDELALEQLTRLALASALYADALACQPWQARLWAEDALRIAVARGVL